MRTEQRRIAVGEGRVGAVWAIPSHWRAGEGSAIVIAHGAGNDMQAPFISTLHAGFAAHGLLSIKFNFPYKERGGKAPDRAPVLEATWRAVIAAVRQDPLAPARVFLAGKSMGGRMASHVAAQGEHCDGLVFFGYPLHPARQPEKLRAAHLPAVRCPMLFIQGTRDPLCDLAQLRDVLVPVHAAHTVHVIDGADHSFKLPRRSGRGMEDVMQEIVATTVAWMNAST
jgi:predicted alpha/beta-hydrolase family hydrolase